MSTERANMLVFESKRSKEIHRSIRVESTRCTHWILSVITNDDCSHPHGRNRDHRLHGHIRDHLRDYLRHHNHSRDRIVQQLEDVPNEWKMRIRVLRQMQTFF